MKDLGHCTGCYKRLTPGEAYYTVKGLRYHHNCLKCHFCKKAIVEDKEKYEYETATNILLNFCCQACLAADRADRCYECREIIVVNPASSAFGRPYHTKCFRCLRCNREIPSSEAFIKDNNRPLCIKCQK